MRVAYGLLAAGLVLASLSTPVRAGAAADHEEDRHLRSAMRQAAGHTALEQRRKAWCDSRRAPEEATRAAQAVRVAEDAYRTAANVSTLPKHAVLRDLVVQRECAAAQAARLQPQVRRPVWLISELAFAPVRRASGASEAVPVAAVARNINGPVVGSRITFSQGLHMACFGITDARGAVQCTLVDTHPHGPESAHEADDEAHEGPLTATLAGSASADKVELPAVVQRAMPTRHSARKHRQPR